MTIVTFCINRFELTKKITKFVANYIYLRCNLWRINPKSNQGDTCRADDEQQGSCREIRQRSRYNF